MPQSFSNKLNSKTQVFGCLGMSWGRPLDMPRTSYQASKGNASNNPPCPITLTITSSSVHHSSYQLTTTFFRITMLLKRPFVPKSDVNQ